MLQLWLRANARRSKLHLELEGTFRQWQNRDDYSTDYQKLKAQAAHNAVDNIRLHLLHWQKRTHNIHNVFAVFLGKIHAQGGGETFDWNKHKRKECALLQHAKGAVIVVRIQTVGNVHALLIQRVAQRV